MRSIRLTNFRGLADTGRVELRPITVLVGANSSGKSSFLRFFPLLRQTTSTPSASPLLWYGRDVDFGDFSQALSRGATEPRIGVEVELEMSRETLYERNPWSRRYSIQRRNAVETASGSESLGVKVSVGLKKRESETYVSDCTLTIDEDSETWQAEENEPQQSEAGMRPLKGGEKPARMYRQQGGLIPHLWSSQHGEDKDQTLKSSISKFIEQVYGPSSKAATSGSNSGVLFLDELGWLPVYDSTEGLEEQLRYFASPRGVRPSRKKPAMDRKEMLMKIKSLLFQRDFPKLLDASNEFLTQYAYGLRYIGPFRANPERFYRQQELMVSQIEPHGENLAMYLRALDKQKSHHLSDFIHRHLGFRLSIKSEGSHVAIMIDDDEGRSFNLIDMGYGFSQVLPVIVQCWASSIGGPRSAGRTATTLLAIEQPELHLHPAHQSRLADIFAGVLTASREAAAKRRPADVPREIREAPRKEVQLLVETHSEALVNRLGELVEEGTLAPSDVSVLLFEKSPDSGVSSVRQATFADDGTLQNWPLGFLSS